MTVEQMKAKADVEAQIRRLRKVASGMTADSMQKALLDRAEMLEAELKKAGNV